jgi:hypothetical protein
VIRYKPWPLALGKEHPAPTKYTQKAGWAVQPVWTCGERENSVVLASKSKHVPLDVQSAAYSLHRLSYRNSPAVTVVTLCMLPQFQRQIPTSLHNSPFHLTALNKSENATSRRFVITIPQAARPQAFQLAGPISTLGSLRGIYGGHNATELSFTPHTSVFPRQYPIVLSSTVTDDTQSRQLTVPFSSTSTLNHVN